MSNEGLAACSMLTLGCVCLRGASWLAGSTGGGTRGLPSLATSSSSSFTDSIIPRTDDPPDVTDVGRALRAANSFCGGAGGSSIEGTEAKLSPNGPRGPSESSSVSRVVDWVPKRRGVRDDLFAGALVLGVGGGALLLLLLLSLDSVVCALAGRSESSARIAQVHGNRHSVLGAASVSSSPASARLLLDCDREGTSR